MIIFACKLIYSISQIITCIFFQKQFRNLKSAS